jgi:hypothetical protein
MCRDEIAPVLKTKPAHIDSLLGELSANRKQRGHWCNRLCTTVVSAGSHPHPPGRAVSGPGFHRRVNLRTLRKSWNRPVAPTFRDVESSTESGAGYRLLSQTPVTAITDFQPAVRENEKQIRADQRCARIPRRPREAAKGRFVSYSIR